MSLLSPFSPLSLSLTQTHTLSRTILLFSMSSSFHHPRTLSPLPPVSAAISKSKPPHILLHFSINFKLKSLKKGVHAAPFVRVPSSMSHKDSTFCCYYHNRHFFLICIIILLQGVASFGATESESLLTLKRSLENTDKLASWQEGKGEPCTGDKANWEGLICWKGNVWGLQLDGMGLRGIINVDSLKELEHLRVVSFMRNNFGSTMPDFKQLMELKVLYLSDNHFSGEIADDAFENMSDLKKVHLANNKFIGTIPSSLADLPELSELRLEGNQFEGTIPDFHIKQNFKTLNVSNNALEGPIPDALNKMDASAFQGNKALCGPPLASCSDDPNSAYANKRPSVLSIVVLAIVVAAALAAIVSVIFILHQRKQTSSSIEDPPSSSSHRRRKSHDREIENLSSHGGSTHSRKDNHKLSFLRDDRGSFDLQDLLKASAEILGSGCFGASYKAALLTGPVLVVKRFKQLNNVGKREFNEHMRRLGRLNHPNLLPIVAYYYRKEEKLLVTDFVEMGSLAVCLHGHQSIGLPSLDWPTRLKIVKGVAKGLQYLYTELPSLIAPHGHLKSSNVLLNESFEPLLTDYGLIPIVNQESAQELMVAYKSPEYEHHGRVTKKTDVWAFGILILEILTGRFPANFLHQGKSEADADLVSWVQSVFRGEWTKEVVDREMGISRNNEGEIVKLLKLALACCEDVDKRLDMKEVVEKIQELKEATDDDFYTSYGSEGDPKSSNELSDDFNFS